MANLLVIGAGAGGLGGALLFAKRGHDVTVLERDADEPPGTPEEAWERWARRGVPQVRQSHAFLGRVRQIAAATFPELLDELEGARAYAINFTERMFPTIDDPSPKAGDEDLVAIGCRRTTLEWALRRVVADQPNITVRSGVAVGGLLSEASRVTGVRTAKGEEIAADLVIDASGRRSPLAGWLSEVGAPMPTETTADCGQLYYTRWYRLRADSTYAVQEGLFGADLGYLAALCFPADNGVISVTFAAHPDDEPLRALRHASTFERVVAAIPRAAEWVAAAEPISDVSLMARLENRYRHVQVDGLAAIGDSLVVTNPAFGRGVALALMEAEVVADTLDDVGLADIGAFTAAAYQRTRAAVEPWFIASVATDQQRLQRRGRPPDPSADDPLSALFQAMQYDASIYRTFMRVANLLSPPGALLDPALHARVREVLERHGPPPAPPRVGPTRDELLALLELDEDALAGTVLRGVDDSERE